MDTERQLIPGFITALANGRAWLAKTALAMGPERRADAEKMLPGANWDELRQRDARLGKAYRAALAEAGLQLPSYPASATTQPAR